MKTAVEAAPEADLFLVPCTSPDGVLVFLVASSDGGVRVEPQRLTDFGSAGRLVLEGCRLDDDRVSWRPSSTNSRSAARRPSSCASAMPWRAKFIG
jgi:alkylation response protein AidB-like acyl-CoA dehydrogenase